VSELCVIVGPTASGKTELAVRVAEKHDAEVISADSVQIYRHFDIGSGKPSAEQRRRAVHHLIDLCDPHEPMDAAKWAELAEARIREVRARGKRPVVCGGTFLWVRVLLYGLAPAPPADAQIRARHRALAEKEGRAHLHEELKLVDPAAAARLEPNDFVRVSRALEVYELSKLPLSQWQAAHGFRVPRYTARLFGLGHAREELDRRILSRVRDMMKAGFVEEVAALLRAGYSETRAMRSVGYRQVADALKSGQSIDTEKLVMEIYRATRVFARRQRTWLRDEAVSWLTPEQARAAAIDETRAPSG
jgi:tRNA dimethylallyltransferase